MKAKLRKLIRKSAEVGKKTKEVTVQTQDKQPLTSDEVSGVKIADVKDGE